MNSVQELDSLRARVAQEDVNVEVDAARGPELGSVLSELRSQYEGIVRKNKEEAEDWYRKKVSDVNRAVLLAISILIGQKVLVRFEWLMW